MGLSRALGYLTRTAQPSSQHAGRKSGGLNIEHRTPNRYRMVYYFGPIDTFRSRIVSNSSILKRFELARGSGSRTPMALTARSFEGGNAAFDERMRTRTPTWHCNPIIIIFAFPKPNFMGSPIASRSFNGFNHLLEAPRQEGFRSERSSKRNSEEINTRCATSP